MTGRSKDYPKQLLIWWVKSVQRHAVIVVLLSLTVTAGVLFYSIKNFSINVDTGSMISEKLPFRKLEKDFSMAFPQQADTLVAVIDAETAEQAVSARKNLAARMRTFKDQFISVEEPGGDSFFENNGLLYLSVQELEEFGDAMAGAQPLMALLSEDLSLRGLFSMIEKVLSQPGGGESFDKRVGLLFGKISDAFEGVSKGLPNQLSWQALMLGDEEASKQRHQFVILKPRMDLSDLSSGEIPIRTLRSAIREIGLDGKNGVNVRITGDVALSHENLLEVRKSVGVATFASLLLVAAVLYIGLGRSGRLVFACIATLIAGLILTTGFAIAFIGSLNLISITFAVLFVGLGIDYSIQFCLRYRELISPDHDESSIVTTAGGVGRSLLVSCITIAIGFYSFVPTAYSGVAELGLISGTGMFISFFANITLLPALLTLFPLRKTERPLSSAKKFLNLPYKHGRTIAVISVILGLGAGILLPKVYFDYNPLNLYNKKSEAITAIKDMFKDPLSSPWTISILVAGKERTRELSEELGKLKEVKQVIDFFGFVPENQSQKLGIISDIRLFMPSKLANMSIEHLSSEEGIRSLDSLEKTLKKYLLSSDNPSVRRLSASIQHFRAGLATREKGGPDFAALENALLSNLPSLFKRLELSLQAAPFDESVLPKELTGQYISTGGQYRVQVFPSEDITNREALERFVGSVRSVAPDATDAPVTIYESGKAVVSSFRQAVLVALIFIALYLLIESRRLFVTGLILAPLALAMALTAAASVLFGIPFNFANVIVVPLLLGVGVHSSLIFVLRYRTEPPADGNMLRTSTARAIMLSTLTMLISSASLAFSAHKGIASMGMLLSICLGFLMFSTLVLLPALLELSKHRITSDNVGRHISEG